MSADVTTQGETTPNETPTLSRRGLFTTAATTAVIGALAVQVANETITAEPAYAASRFSWPFDLSLVTAEYGPRDPLWTPNGWTPDFHTGIDFGKGSASSTGSAVRSAGAGTVVRSDNTPSSWGNRVDVAHGDGLVTIYRHMNRLDVVRGQPVSSGTVLGGVGKTGTATGVHLHFQTEVNGQHVNPRDFMASYNSDIPPALAEEDDMVRLAQIPIANNDPSTGVHWIVIDHGQRAYWHVGSMEAVNYLRAQGIREVSGAQPTSIISGYRNITNAA